MFLFKVNIMFSKYLIHNLENGYYHHALHSPDMCGSDSNTNNICYYL